MYEIIDAKFKGLGHISLQVGGPTKTYPHGAPKSVPKKN